MKTSEIRSNFLQFFESKGHKILPSSSLIPNNDPTLLFTNSGMVQFKDIFIGKEKAEHKKITTVQRCFRAGGKHNDLENVGYTARHHTFFEMLGNFSFGDYFKREAIHYAWELLTKVYKLPENKLFITVYQDDDEAYDIWNKEIGVPCDLISRIGDNKGARFSSDNFWQMADVGPCGPCSEIYYDHGPSFKGDPPGVGSLDGDRYIEIWNLVFMQFYMDQEGNMSRLSTPCIDTGMGLERIAAVIQHVHSNYETDTFKNLILAIANKIGINNINDNSLKVIADHVRACSFLIIDGVLPSNEGRGYVLRRIIRRALRHSYKLGHSGPFLYKIVPDLILEMGSAYPDLIKQSELITKIILQEEDRFGETLAKGMKILNASISKIDSGNKLDGITTFNLYDTYGFPIDLTADVCREKGISVDLESFDREMESQRVKARLSGKFKLHSQSLNYNGLNSIFVGYDHFQTDNSKILAIYIDGVSVNSINQYDKEVYIIIDKTPFYAESGGQVGDTGFIKNKNSVFSVENTFMGGINLSVHCGILRTGMLSVGDNVSSYLDVERRLNISRNHSATHLLHFALRETLGSHVMQRGSLVDHNKIRFDFTSDFPISLELIANIENLVNSCVIKNIDVSTTLLEYDKAIKSGAMALFDEKYSDMVRVVSIGQSLELCGGTHVKKTGDIGFFKIISESSVSSGVRRLEACTALRSVDFSNKQTVVLSKINDLFNSTTDDVLSKIVQKNSMIKDIEKENDSLRKKLSISLVDYLSSKDHLVIKDRKIISYVFKDLDQNILLTIIDLLKVKFKSVIVLLATNLPNGNINLVCGVSDDLVNSIKANEIMKFLTSNVKGKGGGRSNLATGSTSEFDLIFSGFESTKRWVAERI
ncbi:alanyl-tRNA synthetase [Candidatus Kinetoplastibacterium desouzaii TCC079E]|uniref:Alanine--tRNA ligase n=1 Tax=Candidatus Kinetoplastidibacterium desouzai TCC079E TaxID=1208919 RepID=M1LMJ6_9PROT|nr:alanine--tRNA ligase [Candidatus Kinetoplastibacterium desouzaii]AGF46952.1 alanyl-tRNA synthetase [Candidatus Kinetoplastibacterium desouzaii TCC079E]